MLNLPDAQYTSTSKAESKGSYEYQETLANDEGDFDGFRFDAGIANIPVMDGLTAGVRGFYATHQSSDAPIICGSGGLTAGSGQCFPLPLSIPIPIPAATRILQLVEYRLSGRSATSTIGAWRSIFHPKARRDYEPAPPSAASIRTS